MLVSAISPTPSRQRKYACDEQYFTRLTAESAYWLGFILADGNVYVRWRNNRPQFVFSLYSVDREHLEWFRSCLGSNHPITRAKTGVYTFRVLSYGLCLSLEHRGIVPCKSKIVEMPELPTRLEKHFWRGVIDGDGSFNVYRRPNRAKKQNGRGRPSTTGRQIFTVGIVGSRDICQAFKTRFGGSVSRKAGVWQASLTGQRAITLIQRLYGSAHLALARKRQLAVTLGIIKE